MSRGANGRILLVVLLAGLLAGCAAPTQDDAPSDPGPTPPPPPPPPLFLDDTETDNGWRTATYWAPDRFATFLAGAPHPFAPGWHRTDAEAHSGRHSWTMQDEAMGRYHDSQVALLTSPEIDLSGVKTAHLSFWMKGESEEDSGEDFAWQVSDNGFRFETLDRTDLPHPEWTHVTHDLSDHAGGSLWIRFDMYADWCGRDTPTLQERICNPGSQAGYFLDDIAVTADPPTR